MPPTFTSPSRIPANDTPSKTKNSPVTKGPRSLGITTTRLYISPFNPDLYPTVIPPSVRPFVAKTSYHSTVTFPDKPYGYLELPRIEAEQLRKKLHNTFLKGLKMRVEEARPERRGKRKSDADGDETPSGGKIETVETVETHSARKEKQSRNAKKGDGVLPGVELPEGRHVKRGWTDIGASKKTKKTRRSCGQGGDNEGQGVDDAQMLFRTSVPPNKSDAVPEEKLKGKKKEKQRGKIVEVKEFENTSKLPTFLKGKKANGDTKPSTEFVDGKGWVDDQGNTVEQVSTRSTRKRSRQDANGNVEESANKSGSSKRDGKRKKARVASKDDEQPSDPSDADAGQPEANNPPTDSQSQPDAGASPKQPSALESLFKRPNAKAPRPSPIKTSFTFFPNSAPTDPDHDDGAETGQPVTAAAEDDPAPAPGRRDTRRTMTLTLPPSTPFTRRDLEDRGLRSAAPTPDTAAIGRRMRPPWGRSESREADGSEDSDGLAPPPGDIDKGKVKAKTEEEGEGGENDFEKHFYENRGEYNRAWKARRREAKKERRQEGNRRGAGTRGVG